MGTYDNSCNATLSKDTIMTLKKNRTFMENIEVKLLTSMNFGNPYVRN